MDSPFMAERDRECVPDARDTRRDMSKRDCRAREVSLRESRDTTSKTKGEQERSHQQKHSSLNERYPAICSTFPLQPSHVQVVQHTPVPTSSQLSTSTTHYPPCLRVGYYGGYGNLEERLAGMSEVSFWFCFFCLLKKFMLLHSNNSPQPSPIPPTSQDAPPNPADLPLSSMSSSMHIPPLSQSSPGSTHNQPTHWEESPDTQC